MKKIVTIAACALFIASCGAENDDSSKKEQEPKKAESIKINEIDDACKCADAFIIVGNDILLTVGDKNEEETKADAELMKKFESKLAILQNLENKCRKELEVSMREMKECNPEVEVVAKKFEEKF